MSIICDGKKVNQKSFKIFDKMTNKPWFTTGGVFLLFDYVQLIKKIFDING